MDLALESKLPRPSKIYGEFIARSYPNAKVAMLYQHDDFESDYLKGLRDTLGDR